MSLRGMAIHVGDEIDGILQPNTVRRRLERGLDRSLRQFRLGLGLTDGLRTADVGFLLLIAGEVTAARHVRRA